MDSLAWQPLMKATWETIYIVFLSSVISTFFGLWIGLALFLTKEQQALEQRRVNQCLNGLVNITRSIPFIILMISILPLTRALVGTTIGINAAVVPLALAAIPFYARIVESALSNVSSGLIELANALGATTVQLVSKVLIPESLPALIRGVTLTVITLVGYSAMAGAVGGGGLGELAINYGYQRFNVIVTSETVIILVVLVQVVQWLGDRFANHRQLKPLLVMSVALGLACFFSQTLMLVQPQEDKLRVGIVSGWPQEVMKVAQQVALRQYHLHLVIVPFDDYVLPNTALAEGNIDANIFQHAPYLEAQKKALGYPLVAIAKTFVYPLGFYSRQIKQLSEIRAGDLVAVPNDPSNEARALLLLKKAKLLTLKPEVGTLPSLHDIISNPYHLRFKALDAAQLPRVFHDATLVALTNDYVKEAGLTLNQALLKEGADSPYANIIVVRQQDDNNPLFKSLIAVMHSRPVLEATEKLFPEGGAVPAW